MEFLITLTIAITVCVMHDISSRRNRYRQALIEIKKQGAVCSDFELCEHPACKSSSACYLIAEEALKAG